MTAYKSRNMPEAGCDGRSHTSLCFAAFAHPGQHSRRLRGLNKTLPCLSFTLSALQGLSDGLILHRHTGLGPKCLLANYLWSSDPAKLDVMGPGYTSECDIQITLASLSIGRFRCLKECLYVSYSQYLALAWR